MAPGEVQLRLLNTSQDNSNDNTINQKDLPSYVQQEYRRTSFRGYDECGIYDHSSKQGVFNPNYRLEINRLKSFKNWPIDEIQSRVHLAEAGLYYSGIEDRTICYHCSIGIYDWEIEDDPWREHARLSPSCLYVRLIKGDDFNTEVSNKNAELENVKTEASASFVGSDKPSDNVKGNTLCKICLDKEMNVCFVPCGHFIACGKCALSVDICPVCRNEITDIMRVYMS